MKRVLVFCGVVVFGLGLLACATRVALEQRATPQVLLPPVAATSEGAVPITTVSRGGATGVAQAPLASAKVAAPAGTATVQSEAGRLEDVFFDFNTERIREDQKAVLEANAAWLKARPETRVTIEGHADERGTSEYNVALGDRRAKTTREYLVAKGIAANRITVVSYGEEKPFVLGHDETAWRWNRRVHFVVSGQ